MNLLATEKIIWTVPAPAWARRLYKELGELSERQTERKKSILADLPLVSQYRLTLASVSMNEENARESLLTTVRGWFEEKYGIPPHLYNSWYLDVHIRKNEDSVIDYPAGKDLSREQAREIFGVLIDIADWATLMSCLKTVEWRDTPMVETLPEADWKVIDTPDDWLDYHSFRNSFPRSLFAEAVRICNDLNPGVWGSAMDDESKNVGGVSVRG